MQRTVLVCQNVTCQQQGATQVLAAFQSATDREYEVEASACLGQCGSGPMALILPEEIWYSHLLPSDVSLIVEQHLKRGRIVAQKLYPKFHPSNPVGIWIVSLCLLVGTVAMFYWVVTSQPH